MAISIPIFSAQLEKAREATDAANLRSAYAEMMADAISDDSSTMTKTVEQKQTAADWQTSPDFPDNFEVATPTASGSWTLTFAKDAKGLITGVKAARASS